MSSDSDEDSYTNTVSIVSKLKARTTNDSKISDDEDDSITENITFNIDSPVKQIVSKKGHKKAIKKNDKLNAKAVIDLTNISTTKAKNLTQDEVPTIISDDDTHSPINIISVIDSALENVTRGRRGRGRKKRGIGRKTSEKTPRRRSARLHSANKLFEPDGDGIVFDLVNDSNDKEDFEDVNYEVTVKVFWKSQYLEKINMRRFEKMDVIFNFFAEKENLSVNRLLFTMKDKVISKSDTPESLDLKAATIIEGGVLSEQTFVTSETKRRKDTIEVKVLMKDVKKPLMFRLKSTDKMNVLMCLCAEELKIPVSQLKFVFDGDLVKPNDTPISLQLEGGECFDCIRK